MSLLDQPLNDPCHDQLGFNTHADALANFIAEEERIPFTIGIYGPWGSGKTTMMNLVSKQLDSHDNIRSVWFNAWKYDRKEALWNALIQVIFREINRTAKS